MEHTPTILAELEDYLKQNDLTVAEFAERSGVHQRTLNNWILKHRPVAIHQLDRMTLAMGLPEGFFYERYIDHYIIERSPDWRRIEPVLYRCAELDKLEAIQRIVGHIMDNLLYSPKLFDVAENLFAQDRHAAALLLYEGVAEAEKYQHSERLAICQYRLFTIQVGDNQSRNLKAATRFEPFVERLDEIEQLDALKDLANVYRSLQEWDMLYETARKMRAKAEIQYSIKHQQRKQQREEPVKRLSRPMFVYITYADLLCARVCDAQGNYKQALQFTFNYANLDWVIETDENTQHWVNLFKHWAQANTMVNKLLSGDISVLQDYVEYIDASADTKEEDRIVQLLNIMIAANRFHIDVDDVLSRFELDINSFAQLPASTDMYTQQVLPNYLAYFGYELSYYYLYKGMYSDGFKHLKSATLKAIILNNETYFINCLGLFEYFKAYAMDETKLEFSKFIEKVWLNNVKKNGTANRLG
ncbi:helix-turn-helix domain-containing protein [Paenibacillus sp. 23TSA30-6]|uniref:helix-turn-helix domain-containing protein n=1 Tax=Paenibacillus sp. 23TSA30-6 TaxID=2546104 RepID=UPI0017883BA6|nr:helix-turn-helix transcriptional regulator [Paenibacillus sp. 23TSA30-6]MBE0336691.1 XRE family transcriptional regulator [Paenibacillus sp. 23TSA30-6]